MRNENASKISMLFLFGGIAFLGLACRKPEAAHCPPFVWKLIITPANTCDDGRILLTVEQAQRFYISVDGKPTQSDSIIRRLPAGLHHIKITTQTGCVYDTSLVVPGVQPGPQFRNVQTILQRNCAGCHSGLNPQAGYDFTVSCDIIQQAQRISARAIDGNPSPMPPAGLMSSTERNIVLKWIEAGQKFSD